MSDKNKVEKVEHFKVENISTFSKIAYTQKVAAENIELRYFSGLVEIHLLIYTDLWDGKENRKKI